MRGIPIRSSCFPVRFASFTEKMRSFSVAPVVPSGSEKGRPYSRENGRIFFLRQCFSVILSLGSEERAGVFAYSRFSAKMEKRSNSGRGFLRSNSMPDLFSGTFVELVVYFTILAIMIGVAVYVVGLLRADSLQHERKMEEQLDYFRELNSQGKLSAEEFRKIKKRLSRSVVEEWEKRDAKKSEPDPAVLLSKGKEPSVGKSAFSETEPEDGGDTRIVGSSGEAEKDETVAGS